MARHRRFSFEFKRQVVLDVLEERVGLRDMARKHSISRCRGSLQSGPDRIVKSTSLGLSWRSLNLPYLIPRVLLLSAFILLAKESICFAVSPSDTAKEAKLQSRARAAGYGQLTDCENRVVDGAATGELARCGKLVPPAKGPSAPSQPNDLSAGLVRWLITDRAAVQLVDPKGIQVQGARVIDVLDLYHATVKFPLRFNYSRFQRLIDLRGAQLEYFSLVESHIDSINAGDVTVRTDIYLADVISDGDLDINDGKLGGDLHCDGGTFRSRWRGRLELPAIDAEGLKVKGRVHFGNHFSAEGMVRLQGASIAGDLDCSGAEFNNPEGIALNADDLKARNVVLRKGFLGKGFKATGMVSLIGAELGEKLDCSGAEFNNPEWIALNADDLKARNVFLQEGFKATGEVDFIGAELGDNLVCNGQFNNPKRIALNADDLKARNVVLGKGFKATGTVSLVDATVSGVFGDGDLEKCWLTRGSFLNLDGFVYGRFKQKPTAEHRLDWLKLQQKPFPPQPYEQLANVLRANGDDSGARAVLMTMEGAMRLQEADNQGEPWRTGTHVWNWILWATIGYGYSTWRAVVFSAILVLFGALLFTYGSGNAWIISTEEHPGSYTPFSGIIYSLETLLPFVDLYQAKHWIPNAQTRGGRNLRRYLWVHTLLGWFFASMILAGLSGVVQK